MVIEVIPRLKEILQELDMTQEQLSELTGIPQGTISRFDKNDAHKAEHVAKILLVLEKSYFDLFVVKGKEG